MAISLSDIPRPVGRAPAPDRITVYDTEGNAYEKWPIDARECVESGSFYYEKPAHVEATKAKEPEAVGATEPPASEAQASSVNSSPLDAIDLAAMTKTQLIEQARARGLAANNTMSKDSLIDLLGGAT